MDLVQLVDVAARQGASDLHLEPDLPVTIRVRGGLVPVGEAVVAVDLERMARDLLDADGLASLETRGSADLSRRLGSVRCRVNVARTGRGIGLAVRLFPRQVPTIASLNLHPQLKQLALHAHGLVLVCGPTGSGKSSTVAALLQEINATSARHVVTVEQPIEYQLRPERAFVRQREVGRDTPSFEQALIDALREDIDVLMVGEMREREVMRLTLDACETGHLVLATVHSSTTTEALQRIISAFPATEQESVRAQIADCLISVINQGLVWNEQLELRVPELEVLSGSTSVRSIIRGGQLFKLASAIQTGARDDMWTKERYRGWMAARESWVVPAKNAAAGKSVSSPPRAGDIGDQAPGTPESTDVIVIDAEEDASMTDILSDLDER